MLKSLPAALLSLLLPLSLFSQESIAGSIEAALRSQRYDQALTLIRAALEKSPSEARLLTLEGIALSRTGRPQEALRAYDRALAVSPKNLAALEGAAEIEYNAKSKRAIPLLNRILALEPDNSTSHAMLAVTAFQQHDCATAVRHFQQSSSLIDGQAMALGAYGSCLMQMQRAADAVPVFQQIANLNPKDSHARYNLAVVQLRANQWKEATVTLQPLLDSTEPNPDALDLASAACESMGDTPRAVDLLRQAILAAPQKPQYYLDFATLSFNHNSFQVGIDMVDAGLKQLPQSADLYVARGMLYIQLGRYDKGAADFEDARKIDPGQASISLAQGLAQMQASQLDQALRTVNSQLASQPNDAFLHYLKAEIISRNGAPAGSEPFQSAVTSAARAVQLKPDFTLARNVLGNLYLKSGQVNKAIEQSRQALRYDTSDEVAIYHLLQGLRRTKDPNGEIPELTKRLAAARETSKQKEAAQSRYKLYEPDTPDAGR